MLSSFTPKQFDQFQIQNTDGLKYLTFVYPQAGSFALFDVDVQKDQKWSFESSVSSRGNTLGQAKLGHTTIEASATVWTIDTDSNDEAVIHSSSGYLSATGIGDSVELVSHNPSMAFPTKMKWKIIPFSIALTNDTKYNIANVGRTSTNATQISPTQYQKSTWTINQQGNGRYTILLNTGSYLARKQNPVTGSWSIFADTIADEWDVNGTSENYTIGFTYDHPLAKRRENYIFDVDANDEPELEFLSPGNKPSQNQTWTFTKSDSNTSIIDDGGKLPTVPLERVVLESGSYTIRNCLTNEYLSIGYQETRNWKQYDYSEVCFVEVDTILSRNKFTFVHDEHQLTTGPRTGKYHGLHVFHRDSYYPHQSYVPMFGFEYFRGTALRFERGKDPSSSGYRYRIVYPHYDGMNPQYFLGGKTQVVSQPDRDYSFPPASIHATKTDLVEPDDNWFWWKIEKV